MIATVHSEPYSDLHKYTVYRCGIFKYQLVLLDESVARLLDSDSSVAHVTLNAFRATRKNRWKNILHLLSVACVGYFPIEGVSAIFFHQFLK